MESVSDTFGFRHDAFLSYSRKDRVFAVLLERTLEKHRLPEGPGMPKRYPDIFRDEEDFTGTDYPEALSRQLKNSKKLIVICSPSARESLYVNEEIRLFAAERGAVNIIPLLLSGMPNNEAAPSQQKEMAFPDALMQVMAMPLAADFRGFDPGRHRPNKIPYEGPWFKLLADIYDQSRSEIEQREKRRQERLRRTWAAGISIAMVILSALSIWALYSRDQAVKQRIIATKAEEKAKSERDAADEARKNEKTQRGVAEQKRLEAEQSAEAERKAKEEEQRQRQIALFRQLAAQAELNLNQQPGLLPLSVLLSIESLQPERKLPSLEGYQALRHGLGLLPFQKGLLAHEGPVRLLGFSSGAEFLATVFRDENNEDVLQVWNLRSRSILLRHAERNPQKSDWVIRPRDIALSPQGSHLAMVHGGLISVWDVRDPKRGKPITLPGQLRTPKKVLFSPDGRWFAAIGYEGGVVRTWDVMNWKPLPHDKDGPAEAVAFSPDSRLLVTVGRGFVQVRETEGKKRVAQCRLPQAESVTLGTGGAYVAGVLKGRSSAVWKTPHDAGGGNCTEVTRIVHQGGIKIVAVSKDGRYLATVGMDGTARIWSVEERSEIARMSHDGMPVSAVEFRPEGSMIATAGTDGTVRLWELGEERDALSILHDQKIVSMVFGPRGEDISFLSDKGVATVWSLEPAGVSLIQRVDLSERLPEDLPVRQPENALSPNGAYAASSTDGELSLWEMKNGKALANVRLGSDTVLALAVSPAGDLIAMIEDEGTLRLRRRDGTAESVPDMGDVISIAFSPNGAYLAAERQEQGVLLWDVKAKRQAWHLAVTGVFDLQFSPDSSHLAFGLEKNITQIWSLKTGRQIARIHHGKAVKVRALGPGGRYLATTGDDGVASIWSIPGGIEIARLAREAAITALAFSPDGKRIAIASEDHTVSVSLWIPEDLINEACSRLTRNLSREEWQAYMGEEPYRQTCRNLPAR